MAGVDGCHCDLKEPSTRFTSGAAPRSHFFQCDEGELRDDMQNGLQLSLLDMLMLFLSGWLGSNGKQGSLYVMVHEAS